MGNAVILLYLTLYCIYSIVTTERLFLSQGAGVQITSGKLVFLVPLAYDRIQNNTGRGTMARCDVIIEFAENPQHSDCQYVVVLTAGYSKESPTCATVPRMQSLAQQMRLYMKPYIPEARYIIRSVTWGTRGEISEATALIREYCNWHKVPVEEVCIVTSSNFMHLHGRVKSLWKRHAPDIKVRYLTADHSFTLREVVQETVKFTREFVASLV